MRAMRSERHRSRTSCLSAGNTDLLYSVQFGDNPVHFRSRGCAAKSSRLWAASVALGNSNLLHGFLGIGRARRYRRGFQGRCKPREHSRRSLASCRGERYRDALQLSANSPLQPNCSSPAPLELGAHLYLQSMRKVAIHPFIAGAEADRSLLAARTGFRGDSAASLGGVG